MRPLSQAMQMWSVVSACQAISSAVSTLKYSKEAIQTTHAEGICHSFIHRGLWSVRIAQWKRK